MRYDKRSTIAQGKLNKKSALSPRSYRRRTTGPVRYRVSKPGIEYREDTSAFSVYATDIPRREQTLRGSFLARSSLNLLPDAIDNRFCGEEKADSNVI